ncbi:MAG: hypothetical protein ABIR59_07835 [Gemmatimonadales bacterium]
MARTSKDAIHSYVTDMLALEDHIEKAIMAQVEDFEGDYPAVGVALRGMHATIERHITSLRGLEDLRDSGPRLDVADFIKRAASTVAGLGAAAIDLVRTEKLPKNLRDDYTAFSLATIGYVMLHTTARSLGDARVAAVAENHLTDYAGMVMALNDLIPSTVVTLLKEEGLPALDETLPGIEETIHNAWRQKA